MNEASHITRIALTPGEPAGIGPDLCVMLAQKPAVAELVVLADPALLEQRAARLGLPLRTALFDPDAVPAPPPTPTLRVIPVALRAPAKCGRLDPANAPYVIETLERAVRACREGWCAALVTGPVHKGVLNDAGVAFTGHTEMLAELTGGHPVMLLAAPGLRVALVTTHLSLRAVPDAITPDRLESVLETLHRELHTRLGIAGPRILVCGLNPHAGEGGHLGSEDAAIIRPVLDRLRSRGMALAGPVPADTAFTPDRLAGADAVLAMYHDQGLPVLKHLGFGRAVNITLGLPILRTSVDHGTAVDVAGTGRADSGSLEAAVQAAVTMVYNARAADAERSPTGDVYSPEGTSGHART